MAAPSARVGERFGQGGIALQLDTRQWGALAAGLRRFAPQLLKELRSELRSAGEFAVKDVRRTLGMPSPDDGPDTGEYRRMLAAAAKISISFSGRSAGVSVSTNNKGIPESHQAIMRAYNRDSFRHPVFGDPAVWVQQKGRPYFGQVFEQMVFDTALVYVNRALGNATAALERYRSA